MIGQELGTMGHDPTSDLPEGFQMTELGPLPKEWRVVRLGEVARMKQGRVLPTSSFTKRGYPVYGANGQIGWFNQYTHAEEEVLVTCRGATCGTINVSPPKSFITNNAMIVTPIQKDRLRKDYLALALHLADLNSCITGSGQPQITKGKLALILIPIPPLDEQRAIAHVLRTVQRAKEATDGVIAAFKDLKKSLMQHLFTYGPVSVTERERVAMQETEIGPLPAHWRVVRLGEVFDILQGKSLSAKQNKGIRPRPFLRTSNVYWGYLDLSKLDVMDFAEEEEQKFALRYGDLLVCEGGDVGRTAMWEGQMQGVYYQNHLHRLRAKDNNVNPAFVMYWLQTAFTLLNLYSGSSNKTTIPNLSQGRLAVFPIPLPPLSEQREIARTLQAVDAKIDAEQARRAALEELFKTLLHQLMTGKIRVRGLIPTTVDSAESAATED